MQENNYSQEDAYNQYWNQKKQITLESYITLFLVILNCLLLIATLIEGPDMYRAGALIADNVISGKEIYRMITSLFLHADIEHLFASYRFPQ